MYFAYTYKIKSIAYQDLPLRLPPPVQFSKEYVVTLNRGNERTKEIDTSLPFRNSILSFRDNNADLLTTFVARGRSTAVNRPEITDIASYIKKPTGNDNIRWGFKELPQGDYWIKAGSMESGKFGFMISGVGTNFETIISSESQTIRITPIIFDDHSSPSLDINNEQIERSTNVRSGCWIHGSPTKYWSHRDSIGCVTIFEASLKDKERGLASEWERFLNVMQSAGLTETTSPAILFRIRENG